MNQEEKIHALQAKIHRLSADISSSLHQIRVLQTELDELKTGFVEKIKEERKKEHDTSLNTPVVSSPSQGSGGIENFIGLKLMHLVGIVVLVIGISIGVKYAIDQELVSESVRILLAYAAGILLYILSVRLKRKYTLFSAILFSGSMASVYFTTYAAFVYYQFFPAIIAFLIMVSLTVYTVISAISYNRKEIAIIGMIGAYGIPFLISANAEKVELFFSYILLINLGVVFLSFKKGWKLMGYIALVITWMLFIGWGFFRYKYAQQEVAIVFMFLYYALFLINAIVFGIRHHMSLMPGEVQQIILNNIALYAAAILVFNSGLVEAGLATITGFMFLLTGILALASSKIFVSETLLQRLLAWQSLIFLLLFIVFQWDGLAVTLLWVAVSIVLFLWGIFSKKSWARLASVLLIGITLVKLLVFDSAKFSTIQKISSYIIIGVLLLLFSFYYQKPGLSDKKQHN